MILKIILCVPFKRGIGYDIVGEIKTGKNQTDGHQIYVAINLFIHRRIRINGTGEFQITHENQRADSYKNAIDQIEIKSAEEKFQIPIRKPVTRRTKRRHQCGGNCHPGIAFEILSFREPATMPVAPPMNAINTSYMVGDVLARSSD